MLMYEAITACGSRDVQLNQDIRGNAVSICQGEKMDQWEREKREDEIREVSNFNL